MGINVKLYGNILTILYIELLDTVFAKDSEHTTTRILAGNLDNIVLRHPVVASACRYAALCWYDCNNSTC